MEASNSHMGKRGGTAGLLFFTAVSIDFGLPFPLKKRRILQNPSQQPPPPPSLQTFSSSPLARKRILPLSGQPPLEPLPNPKKRSLPLSKKRSNSTPAQTPFLQSGRRKEGAYRLTRLALPKKEENRKKVPHISISLTPISTSFPFSDLMFYSCVHFFSPPHFPLV